MSDCSREGKTVLKYKLLALDLDGTLTSSQKQVSPGNRAAIRKAQEAGCDIILASGRPVLGIQKVADALDLHTYGGYILAYNGGQIIDCRSGKDLVKRTIPHTYYHDICECGHRFPINVLTYNSEGVIAESDSAEYVRLEGYNNSIPVIKVESLEKAIKGDVVKFMAVGEPDDLKPAFEYMKELFAGKLNVFFSEPYFLEITPPGIDKAASLENLLKILGVAREELIACGDGLNDIPMLEYAGFSVAMGNAYEETKELADVVVASNDEDGVAEAIERFIL